METRANYIRRLQDRIQELHACSAQHLESVRVTEIFRGDKTWQGTVEVFDVTGHSHATRAYGWSNLKGMPNSHRNIVAILGIPPVDSPLAAVRAWIVGDVEDGKR